MTPVHMQTSRGYRQVIRAIHVLHQFDRIMIAALYKMRFGTVSRIFSELENEKYIVRMKSYEPMRNSHSRARLINNEYPLAELRQNADLKDFTPNYGSSMKPKSIAYTKSPRWHFFMKRWSEFLVHEARPRRKRSVV